MVLREIKEIKEIPLSRATNKIPESRATKETLVLRAIKDKLVQKARKVIPVLVLVLAEDMIAHHTKR